MHCLYDIQAFAPGQALWLPEQLPQIYLWDVVIFYSYLQVYFIDKVKDFS